MKAPLTPMGVPYTVHQARHAADMLQRAMDEGWRYFPVHKYEAIKQRIEQLREWARLGLN